VKFILLVVILWMVIAQLLLYMELAQVEADDGGLGFKYQQDLIL
jgi:hypothetical protein